MLNLPQKTLDTIKNKLLLKQKEVEEELKQVEKDDPVKSDGLAEPSEQGMDSWMAEGHNRVVALGDELKKMGAEIKIALGKIKNGTYGKCEKCKNQIETSRLLVMPSAKYCLKCSQKASK